VVVVPPPAPAVVLQDIYFDFNRTDIRADAAETLKKNVECSRQNPGKKVRSRETLILRDGEVQHGPGQRRADAAKAYLIKLGIEGTLLQTVSYGATKPACPRKTKRAGQKQRRVTY